MIGARGMVSLSIIFLALLSPISTCSSGDDAPIPPILTENLFVNGTVFEDLNADGFRGEGEPGLPGWTVRLLQDHAEIASTTTDEPGNYRFDHLLPGQYEIIEDDLLQWNQTAPGGGSYQIALADKPAYHLDFGNYQGNAAFAAFVQDHPLMHFSPDEMDEFVHEYESAPQAYLSPEIGAKLAAAPTGGHFDLFSYLTYTPAERHQGSCGNCWIWTGTGVLEIDNARRNAIFDRLSIQYMNSVLFNGLNQTPCRSAAHNYCEWACCGGTPQKFSNFYNSQRKVVPWSNANAHWQDGARTCGSGSTSVPASFISVSTNYPLASVTPTTIPTQNVPRDKAIANIKNVLNQGKGIWLAYYLPNRAAWKNFNDFWNSQPESAVWRPDFACGTKYDSKYGSGHAVLCLGYDDSDPQNRYWIILNSWGAPANRPSGIFRMSMDMNYDCSYPSERSRYMAFYWTAFDVKYTVRPNTPSSPHCPVYSGYAGDNLRYSTRATHPDREDIKYTFFWGDGTTTETGFASSGEIGAASHRWITAGDYNVYAKATDRSGRVSDWSAATKAVIRNAVPSKPATPSVTLLVFRNVNKRVYTYSIDPKRSPIRYTFDWGDGTRTTTGYFASHTGAHADHVWRKTGTYPVKVFATNSKGATSQWSNIKYVTVYNKRTLDKSGLPSDANSVPRVPDIFA